MQFNVSLIVGVLVGTIALAPRPAPSAQPLPVRGTWQAPVIVERRAPAGASDATWELSRAAGRAESQVASAGRGHRVVTAWSELEEMLVPGEAVPLTCTALVMEAALEAGCAIEMVAWQGGSTGSDDVPSTAVRLVATGCAADAPAGAVAQASAAWRVPPPGPGAAATLHVRISMTHRGNTYTRTRSYTWAPAGSEAAD